MKVKIINVKYLVGSLLWIGLSCWFSLNMVITVLDEIHLLNNKKITHAKVTSQRYQVEEGAESEGSPLSGVYYIDYKFQISDREFTGYAKFNEKYVEENLKDIEIEYDTTDPSRNQVAGAGSSSMSHALFKIAGILIFCGFLCYAGWIVLKPSVQISR